MKRSYYRRNRLVEVEQVDGLMAVQTGTPPSDERVVDPESTTLESTGGLQAETLEAFSHAGWFVLAVDDTTDSLESVTESTSAESAGSVVINADGRAVIATDVLNVQLTTSLSAAEAERTLESAGLTVLTPLRFAPNLFQVRVASGDALDASVLLHNNPQFVFAEPEFVEHIPQRLRPSDPDYGDQWQWNNTGSTGGTAGADVDAEGAWDHTQGAGIRVAVIDNGFDADHEDLDAGVGPGSAFFTAGTPASLTVGTAGMPNSNHGTFCAGMVGARRNNGDGGVGAAPDCELMLVACLNDQVGTQTTLARAVAYAADPSTEVAGADPATGADIIVSSLGPNGADWALTTVLELALENAAANGRRGLGTAIFWAASNGNNVSVSRDEVVSHPDVIAVVRSTHDDLEDNAARGPEVELIAPGVDVYSTESGDDYGTSTGTSFAAPCAAGCAALALSVNPGLSRDGLREIMRTTADQIGGVVYDANGHNDDYGFGRVNAHAAVVAAARRLQLTTHSVVFNDIPEDETTARAIVWDVSGVEPLTFTVVSGPSTTTGPANSFQLLLGSSVTVPATGVGVTAQARLWLSYTGTTAGDTATGEIVVRSVETGEEWTVALSANTVERPTAAVVMVLDKSGSMDFNAGDGRTRVEVLRESAHVLVDLLRPETGIGVVRFDHDAVSEMAVTDAGPEIFGPGRAQAGAVVSSHAANPAGATSIGDGIAAAGVLLDAVTTTYDKTAMIVLTDGQENAPAFIADVAGSIDDTVFAIGLGEPSAINPAALTAVTNGTGGYVSVTGVLSADERFLLAKYYLQILAGVTNEQIVLDPAGFVRPGDTVEIPFELTRADAATDVIVLTPGPPALRFTLRTPSGATVDPGNAQVRFVTGEAVCYYRFSLPLVDAAGEHWAGAWTAVLECDRSAFDRWLKELRDRDPKTFKEAITHGLRYALEIHARSSLTLTASLHQKDIQPGSTMRLTAQLTESGLPVDDDRARVRAEVTGPRGPEQLEFKGSGNGMFEAEFAATEFGVYRFRVMAEGRTLRRERFSREQLLSGSIYAPKPPEGDPKPPTERPPVEDKDCAQHLKAFVTVIGRDRALATSLDTRLRRLDSSLDAFLGCVRRCAQNDREDVQRELEPASGDTPPAVSANDLAQALRRVADELEQVTS